MDNLTKEQKILLCSMYKDFLSRSSELPVEKANYFNDSDYIQQTYLQDHSSEYVSDLCWKLKSKDFINCYPGDNLANMISITDETIIYMENRFKNGLGDVLSFILQFKP